jgi:copper chaperone CopZ
MPDHRTRTVTRLAIAGMTSVHAIRAIFTALAGVEGVIHADVSRGGALVEHDDRVSDAALREAVTIAGFEVTEMTRERRVLPVL